MTQKKRAALQDSPSQNNVRGNSTNGKPLVTGQCLRVLLMLRAAPVVTTLDMQAVGIMYGPARISDLIDKGYAIHCHKRDVTDANGLHPRVGHYSLLAEAANDEGGTP